MAAFVAIAEASTPSSLPCSKLAFSKMCSTGRSERARIHQGAGPKNSRRDRASRTAPADAAPRVDAPKQPIMSMRKERPGGMDLRSGFSAEKGAQSFSGKASNSSMQELLQPLVQDLPLTLGPLIVRKPQALLPCLPPVRTHGPLPSTTFDRLGTIMPCLETLQRAGTTAGGTQAVALIGGVTAERLLADRDMTPMRFLSRRQDRGCRRSLCPKAGVQSGVVTTKSLTGPGT